MRVAAQFEPNCVALCARQLLLPLIARRLVELKFRSQRGSRVFSAACQLCDYRSVYSVSAIIGHPPCIVQELHKEPARRTFQH